MRGALRLADAGVRVAKIQLSCALRAEAMDPLVARQLQSFDDGVYLHQVVRRGADGLRRHADLPQALALPADAIQGEAWRVHCHVPLFWQAPPRQAWPAPATVWTRCWIC
ncbi:Uncharacterised protein [Chromobacterium violaceum]|uniref:Uncharacterized protein n=1 Tax=Chromobacterium violaceum TaxID=536 RepID=A0A3S4JYJ6_CHRVL|nr:Uncharacterised protein [Chromobacterium violaceum]